MNTLLLTSQLVCYGVGIVSASLNIAMFVRRHRRWRQFTRSRLTMPAIDFCRSKTGLTT
jgi:hypothetical protein